MGEFKNQDKQTEQQDVKAAFGQFDKDKAQPEQGEFDKEKSETDEFAQEKTDKPA